jgi:hypothetical protein
MPKSMPSTQYQQARERMLAVLNEYAPVLSKIEWRGRCFPWDDFCKANPGAQALADRVNRELNYELSENQCSWAVVAFCEGVRRA